MKPLSIAIACHSLCIGRGGNERVAVNLAIAMLARGHSPLLLSHSGPKGQNIPAYPIPPGVEHFCLNGNGWHGEIAKTEKLLKERNIDVLLSLGSSGRHFFWALACAGPGTPLIYSESSDPLERIEKIDWNRAGRYAALYSADFIHELLPAYVESVPRDLRDRVRVISNAAPEKALPAKITESGRKNILFLGRFCEEKRPWLLIEAFGQLADNFPDWDLVVWGHGKLERSVKKAIASSRARDRIRFMGLCDDPPKAFADAQLYCLPSSHEGFPVAALEAMAAGLPVAGFRRCSALANIIRQGETGLLAEEDTAAGLAQSLAALMSDFSLRKRLSESAKNEASLYAPDLVWNKWENLFREAARKKGKTVMSKHAAEGFTPPATLSAKARQEYILRPYLAPMPWSMAWIKRRAHNLCMRLARRKK